MHEQQIHPKIYIGKTSNLYIKEIEEIIQTYPNLEKLELREQVLALANNRIASQNIV